MSELYNTILYEPIFNLLVFFYNITGDNIGIAIILLTIIIKVALFPLSAKSIKSQKDLQKIQPKIQEVQKKFKGQRERLSQELMALYKREKINPFSSCLPLLIQLPFLIAVFHVFNRGLSSPESLSVLYSFVQNPGQLNPLFFGIDLAQPNIWLAVVAGGFQFVQAKMLVSKKPPMDVAGSKDESMAASMNKNMMYMMPLLTIFIGFQLPGGLMLYWVITTVLTIAQQYFMFHHKTKKPPEKGDAPIEGEVVK